MDLVIGIDVVKFLSGIQISYSVFDLVHKSFTHSRSHACMPYVICGRFHTILQIAIA